MDTTYDWGNAAFKDRCGESLNIAVNAIADVLHTFYRNVIVPEYHPTLLLPVLVATTMLVAVLVRKREKKVTRACV
jgi:hypothetical protein